MNSRDPGAYFNFALPSESEAQNSGAVLHPRFARGATTGLLLGAAAMLLVLFYIGYPLGVVAIICGINGLLEVKKGGGRIKGKALAIAGIIMASIALIGGGVWMSVREEAPQTQVVRRPMPPRKAPALQPPSAPGTRPAALRY